MYSIYQKNKIENRYEFVFSEEAHIFGCNIGLIPRLLKSMINQNDTEPFKWHLNIPDLLQKNGYENKAFIIDIKPYSDENLMAELLNVWGFSSNGWTPFLLEMNLSYLEEDDKSNFVQETEKTIVYSFLYARGSIQNGKLIGTWNPASRSPTNAVLLWPEAIKYFFTCIKDQNYISL